MWLRIEGAPTRIYFADPDDLPSLDTAIARHSTLASIGDIREDTEGETSNVSVTITKASIAHFDDPPLGAIARIQSADGDEFVGAVKTISVNTDGVTTLSLEQ
jgi:hypothetical protein